MGLLPELIKYDERVGRYFFEQRNSYSTLKLISDVLTLSGDEVIFFGITAALAITMSLIRGLGYYRDMGCVEEALWDCFGSCATGTFFESILKLFFQRQRPKYAEQSHFVSIVGEWFSFPSGHSLRAFYFVFWISRSRFVKLLQPVLLIPRARMCMPWAIGVAWSRVAKGRHFPLDVLAGAVLGFCMGWVVEVYLSGYGRAVIKTIGGIFTTANWAYYVLIPALAGNSTRKYVLATFVFYVYALTLLFTSLPVSNELAGAQTIETLDGGSVCKNYW